jgi:hypothetical protein
MPILKLHFARKKMNFKVPAFASSNLLVQIDIDIVLSGVEI